ncbi:PH domain-containing protein [Diaporthe helianthi]|uniref:PH domain-containing protein n=1 Tax=Diaporthe helianthi TaxID=158607 RepID=A0A2P5I212_DIAHE|nr:PH domain-containing protein [Diaporthe helianthi]
MAFLAKFVATKYVGDKLEDNFGPENPRYDIFVTEDGRRKKLKRELPPGLSPQDERALKAVQRKAYRYEWWFDCHCCCGLHVQFGTVTLWGLIPVVGDIISLFNALTLIRAARKVQGGLPVPTLVAMLLWALVDFAIKLIPIVGDILTAIIKPNTRNCMRVEALLRQRAARRAGTGAATTTATASDRTGGPRTGVTVRAPLLASSQPGAQSRMVATSGSSASPSYGTVAAGAGTTQTRGEDRRSTRHLLPFWRRNDDTDSESEGEATR